MRGEYWRQLTWMVAADTETAGLMCAPDTGRKMVVSVAMARPATSPQYAWLVTCSRSQSAPSIAECGSTNERRVSPGRCPRWWRPSG